MYLLNLVDPIDSTYRRRMNRQLTVQESRHTMARSVCHGKRGRIQQPVRQGQDRLAALGVVLNAITLWNTRYLDAAVTALRESGAEVNDEDVAHGPPVPAEGETPERPRTLQLHRHRAAGGAPPAA
jgi:TnpA family transposase